jgi:ribosomal-protein-serine acetyltransferase
MISYPEARQELLIEEGLLLKMLQQESASEIFRTIDRNRNALRTWLPFVDHTLKAEDTELFIRSMLNAAPQKRDLIYEIRCMGKFAGLIALKEIDPWNKKAELGYWLAPDFENLGLMTKACHVLIHSAFRHLDINRLQLKAGIGNAASCRIAEKLGFRLEGIERAGEKFSDRYIDLEVYGLIKKDWQKNIAKSQP